MELAVHPCRSVADAYRILAAIFAAPAFRRGFSFRAASNLSRCGATTSQGRVSAGRKWDGCQPLFWSRRYRVVGDIRQLGAHHVRGLDDVGRPSWALFAFRPNPATTLESASWRGIVPKRKPAERRGRGRRSKADAANKVVGVRLSKRIIGMLDKWARGHAMTRSAAAREIIKRFLDK